MHSPATNSLFFWLAFSWYPFRIFGGHDGMMGVGGNHGHSRRVDSQANNTNYQARNGAALDMCQVEGYEDMRAHTCV